MMLAKIDVTAQMTLVETGRTSEERRTSRGIFATWQDQYQSQFDRQVGFTLC
jgi:hypothetical protein